MTIRDQEVTGSITASWNGSGSEVAAAFVRVNLPGQAAVGVQVSGTFSATLAFEASIDGSTFVSVSARNLTSGAVATTTTATGAFVIHAPAAQVIRVRCSAYTSGTATLTLNASTAPVLLNALGTAGVGASSTTVLASAARTATNQSTEQSNLNGRTLLVYLDVTVASGTGGLQLTLQGKVAATAGWKTLTPAPTAVLTTGTFLYIFGPGGGANSQASLTPPNISIPAEWRINVTHGDGSSYTYSVSASLCP